MKRSQSSSRLRVTASRTSVYKPSKPPKLVENKLSLTKIKEIEKERAAFHAKMQEKEQERLQEIYAKTNINPSEIPLPLPVDITTFDKLARLSEVERKQNSLKKGLGFGVGPRIPLNDKERWTCKVSKYNTFAATPIDPNNDPLPGPSTYNLISQWAEKKLDKAKNKSKETSKPINYFAKISKGPAISPYYLKIN